MRSEAEKWTVIGTFVQAARSFSELNQERDKVMETMERLLEDPDVREFVRGAYKEALKPRLRLVKPSKDTD